MFSNEGGTAATVFAVEALNSYIETVYNNLSEPSKQEVDIYGKKILGEAIIKGLIEKMNTQVLGKYISDVEKGEIGKSIKKLEEMHIAYTMVKPYMDSFKMDLFQFGFSIFVNDEKETVVIAFRSENKYMNKNFGSLTTDNVNDITVYLDLIKNYLLVRLKKENIIKDSYYVIATGFNIGGEIAGMYRLLDNKIGARYFISDYVGIEKRIYEFNAFAMSLMTNQKFLTRLEYFEYAMKSLSETLVITYGVAAVVGAFFGNPASILAAVKAIKWAFLAIVIQAVINENRRIEAEYLYVEFCKMGFIQCNACNKTRTQCKYLSKDLGEYPFLVDTHEKIDALLNESYSFSIVAKGKSILIKSTKRVYLYLLMELYNIGGSLDSSGNIRVNQINDSQYQVNGKAGKQLAQYNSHDSLLGKPNEDFNLYYEFIKTHSDYKRYSKELENFTFSSGEIIYTEDRITPQYTQELIVESIDYLVISSSGNISKYNSNKVNFIKYENSSLGSKKIDENSIVLDGIIDGSTLHASSSTVWLIKSMITIQQNYKEIIKEKVEGGSTRYIGYIYYKKGGTVDNVVQTLKPLTNKVVAKLDKQNQQEKIGEMRRTSCGLSLSNNATPSLTPFKIKADADESGNGDLGIVPKIEEVLK